MSSIYCSSPKQNGLDHFGINLGATVFTRYRFDIYSNEPKYSLCLETFLIFIEKRDFYCGSVEDSLCFFQAIIQTRLI